MTEGIPLQILHHHVGGVAFAADIRDAHDIGVVYPRRHFRLAQEAGAKLRGLRDGGQQRLDREALLQSRMERLIHRPHPALTNRPDDLVAGKDLAGL